MNLIAPDQTSAVQTHAQAGQHIPAEGEQAAGGSYELGADGVRRLVRRTRQAQPGPRVLGLFDENGNPVGKLLPEVNGSDAATAPVAAD